MDVHELDQALLAGSAVLLVAIVAVRLATGTGLPSLLIYLGLGLVLGEALGVRFDDAELTRTLGYLALAVILAEGGLTTSWSVMRPAVAEAGLLATLGIGVSMTITAAVAHVVFDTTWQLAFLLGAVVSSTDAAAVFSVLRRLPPLRPRLVGVLEAESGFNDAAVVILAVALSETTQLGGADLAELAGMLVFELSVGAAIGAAMGYLGSQMIRRIALPASGLYPLAVLAVALFAYALAGLAHASGFLAIYVGALVLGNSRLPHGPATRGFVEGLGWVAQIGLFVLLGLVVSPADLADALLPALGVGLGLLVLARPVSVAVCTVWFRVPWREQAFLSWAGLRGAVPIVMATIPVVKNVPGSGDLFNVVFVIVVVYTVLQAPTLPLLAGRLGMFAAAEPREIDLESAPLERLRAEVLQMRVPQRSRLHGVEVFELRLPPGASLALIVRDGATVVPGPTTRLERGDDLLVVAPAASRQATEARLRALNEHGRLAGWVRPRRPAR